MSPLSTKQVGQHYIDPYAAIVKDPEFESGVTKIQQREVSLMTKEEKRSAKTVNGSMRLVCSAEQWTGLEYAEHD